jgi:hypothetical protein
VAAVTLSGIILQGRAPIELVRWHPETEDTIMHRIQILMHDRWRVAGQGDDPEALKRYVETSFPGRRYRITPVFSQAKSPREIDRERRRAKVEPTPVQAARETATPLLDAAMRGRREAQRLAEARAVSAGMRKLDQAGFDAANATVKRNMARMTRPAGKGGKR